MERSPESDYIETHRELLTGMLDAGDEVGLFFRPTAYVEMRGMTEPVYLRREYDGEGFVPDAEESLDQIDARHFMKSAAEQAHSFGVRLHLSLVGEAAQQVRRYNERKGGGTENPS